MFRLCEGKDSRETINQVHIKPIKSALRKLTEGKDHDCDLFMLDVSVLYKSWIAYLAKWTTSLFADFKSFDEISPFANN